MIALEILMEKLVFALLLGAVVFSLYLGYAVSPAIADPQPSPTTAARLTPKPIEAPSESVTLKLLGVDEAGKGQLAELNVEAVAGTGKVFIAFTSSNPVLQDETQASLKIAVDLGKKFSTRDINSIDLRYSMTAPSQTVGGKSAGAAIAVATMALLTKTKLRGDVAITGGIDEVGRITRVGGVLPKAIAAKDAGFNKFLVPPGESQVFVGKEECFEETVSGSTVRRCITKNVPVDVSIEAGIEVVEGKDVVSALKEMAA